MIPNAILTGSHAYGTPDEDSDVDLVVFMDPGAAGHLLEAIGPEAVGKGSVGYPGAQLKVGRLNLLIATSPGAFEDWVTGTAELVAHAPVTRPEAVAVFKRLRETRRLATALAATGLSTAEAAAGLLAATSFSVDEDDPREEALTDSERNPTINQGD